MEDKGASQDEFLDDEDTSDSSHSLDSYVPATPTRERAIGVFTMVVVAVGAVMVYGGGFALHLWTTYLAYHYCGGFWALLAFMTPVVSELVAVVACLFWGIWYYTLAAAAIAVGFGGALFVYREKPHVIGLLACLLVCAGLTGAFVRNAWKYSLGPTHVTATVQRDLDECAYAAVAVIVASASQDSGVAVTVAENIPRVRKMIDSYDRNKRETIRSTTDRALSCVYRMHCEMCSYIMRPVPANRTRPEFVISPETQSAIDQLPSRLRQMCAPEQLSAVTVLADAENMQETLQASPDKMHRLLQDWLTRSTKAEGDTYQAIFGCAMSSLGPNKQ